MYQGIEYRLRARTAAELADEIERLILTGELAPGARLPPVRAAAGAVGLAPNTVAAAYRSLANRGLILGRGRLGTFVRETAPLPASLVPEIPAGVTDLASGNPDPRLLPDLSGVLGGLGGSSTLYGGPSVHPDLARVVAQSLAGDGIVPDHLAVTGGAVDAIERVLEAWCRPGDSVAVEDPGWFAIVDLLRVMGLVPVPVPVDEEGMSPHGLAAVLERVSAVVLTPRAQNPTGAAITPDRASALGSILARRPSVGVIEDDHMGPSSGAGAVPVGGRGERWAFVRSFSKDLGPDLRVAVVAGDEATVGRVLARQAIGPGWVSHLLQRTVATLLTDRSVALSLERAEVAYQRRRHALVTALEAEGMAALGHSGLNVWVPVSNEEAAVAAALTVGFAIRSGQPFRHLSPPGVRITVSLLDPGDCHRLAAALAGGGRRATRSA